MNKRKLFLIVVVVVGLTLASLSAASAIVFGWPDGDDHPYVGMMVADDADGPAWRCTGTLISPTVFLTAGHCVHGAKAARVWFDTDLTDNEEYPFGGDTSIEGTPIPHPNFTGALTPPNTSDVGVIILSAPVEGLGFGELPEIGLVEELNGALTKDYGIHLSSNPGKGGGTGGSCFGDSGGPALSAEGSNVVVGVGSFGLNANCRGAGFYYRVDTEYAQEFINQHLP